MKTYQFEKELDENTNIEWWAANRCKVNRAIRFFNQWQLDGFPKDQKECIIATLKYYRTMSSYDDPGNYPGPTNDYEDIFDRMENFVKNHGEDD